jgi:hypothetical protein
MAPDETLELLKEDIQDVETVEALQSHVLIANEHFEAFDEVETATLGSNSQRVDTLTEWMASIRSRMEELAEEEDITSYSVTVGGSLTGPSISISVTSSLESE